jgi:hypothetical protein
VSTDSRSGGKDFGTNERHISGPPIFNTHLVDATASLTHVEGVTTDHRQAIPVDTRHDLEAELKVAQG